MKLFKIVNKASVLGIIALLSMQGLHAKMVEFVEDAYLLQAPQEIINTADKAAQLMEFDAAYEVIAPKKPGLQVNPWNRFVSYGINPQTKNAFMVINPVWFLGIPEDQQLFLLGRNLLTLKQGTQPMSVKVMPYLFMLLTFSLMFLLFWILGKTKLADQKSWVRALIAYAIVFVCNLAFLNTLQLKLIQHLSKRYDATINEMVIQKTQQRCRH
jgi:hypothetical protein